MNQSLNLSLNPAAILEAIKRRYPTIISICVALIVLYTGYQISQVTGVQADPKHLEEQKTANKVVSLKGNKAVIEALQKLQPTGDTTVPINLGKNDPFSLD